MVANCYTLEMRQGTFLVRLRGELDLAREPELQEVIAAYLGAGPSNVVVDVGSVTFMDSTGLKLLVSLGQWARRRGCRLTLRQITPSVAQILRIAGLTEAFSVDGPLSSAPVRGGRAPRRV